MVKKRAKPNFVKRKKPRKVCVYKRRGCWMDLSRANEEKMSARDWGSLVHVSPRLLFLQNLLIKEVFLLISFWS